MGGRPSETPGIAVLVKARDGTSISLSATGWYFRSREDIELLRSALEEWRV